MPQELQIMLTVLGILILATIGIYNLNCWTTRLDRVYDSLTYKRMVKFKIVKNEVGEYFIKYKWLIFWKFYSYNSGYADKWDSLKGAMNRVDHIKRDITQTTGKEKYSDVTQAEIQLFGETDGHE